MTQYSRGVTLLEVLIVVAIIGILTVIAVPSYQSHITQSRRTEVQVQMMELKLQQERWRTTNPSYATLAELGGAPDNEYYSITVSNNTVSTYLLTATAKGQQATNDVACKVLTVDQSDTKSPASNCWQN